MLATWLADALRAEGLTVIEAPGWRTRGKATFKPQGVVIHHTANPNRADSPSLNLCIKGRTDLPGPLCNVLLSRSGRCHVIAAGTANHAGKGGWRHLKGNASVFGIEAENDGVGEPWPAVQLDAFHRACAALLGRLNLGSEWVVGHKEWTTRKQDPRGIDMDAFRYAVGRLLTHGGDDMYSDQDRDRDERVAALLIRVEDIVSRIDLNADGRMDAVNAHTTKEAGKVVAAAKEIRDNALRAVERMLAALKPSG